MHTSDTVTVSFFSCHNGPHLFLDGKADMDAIRLSFLLYSFHFFGSFAGRTPDVINWEIAEPGQQKTPHLVRGLSYSDLMINLSYSMTCPAGSSIRFGIEPAYESVICGHAKHFSKFLTVQRLEYFFDHTKLLQNIFLFSKLGNSMGKLFRG